MIRAHGVDPFALQLPNGAARLPFARYVEQLARAPLHRPRFGPPVVEEPARVVEGSRPLRVRNRDRLLMVQAREGVGIGCRASLGNERRALFDGVRFGVEGRGYARRYASRGFVFRLSCLAVFE